MEPLNQRSIHVGEVCDLKTVAVQRILHPGYHTECSARPQTVESIACSARTGRGLDENRSKSCENSQQSTLCKKVVEKAELCHNYEALATE